MGDQSHNPPMGDQSHNPPIVLRFSSPEMQNLVTSLIRDEWRNWSQPWSGTILDYSHGLNLRPMRSISSFTGYAWSREQ